MKGLGALLIVVGYICLAVATLTGIGGAIYFWADGLTLAKALWEGFVLFLKMIGGGLGSLVIGWILVNI